jgi:hypothetical protein
LFSVSKEDKFRSCHAVSGQYIPLVRERDPRGLPEQAMTKQFGRHLSAQSKLNEGED